MRNMWPAWLAALVLAAGPALAAGPEIRTSDVDLFYRIYDAANGRPSAEVLQRDYIDAGSPGVREFVPHRILSGEKLAQRIAEKPEVYARARACAAALPEVRARLKPAFRQLARLYPAAKFPPVTVLIGRNNSGGTTGPTGVLIGLEVVCATRQPDETVADRFVHLIAHEYGHVQQPQAEGTTVLQASLIEGVAELVAELTTGRISNHHLIRWTKGREREIGEAFLKDADSTDFKPWLYNGIGTPQAPGDLGYWQGWRIARLYYAKAADKRAALSELLAMKDPHAILEKSGWKPGD
jgi:hypothetical protein